jgi:hypothetical protein
MSDASSHCAAPRARNELLGPISKLARRWAFFSVAEARALSPSLSPPPPPPRASARERKKDREQTHGGSAGARVATLFTTVLTRYNWAVADAFVTLPAADPRTNPLRRRRRRESSWQRVGRSTPSLSSACCCRRARRRRETKRERQASCVFGSARHASAYPRDENVPCVVITAIV